MNWGEFQFEVMACREATIGLFEDPVSDEDQLPSYEIVIGSHGNTKTYIRRGDQSSWPEDQEADSPGILDCREYVGFVIEWGFNGFVIREVRGTFFFTWLDPDPLPVLHISLTSSIDGALYKTTRTSGKFTLYRDNQWNGYIVPNSKLFVNATRSDLGDNNQPGNAHKKKEGHG